MQTIPSSNTWRPNWRTSPNSGQQPNSHWPHQQTPSSGRQSNGLWPHQQTSNSGQPFNKYGLGFGAVHQQQSVSHPSALNNKKRSQSTINDSNAVDMDIDSDRQRRKAVLGTHWLAAKSKHAKANSVKIPPVKPTASPRKSVIDTGPQEYAASSSKKSKSASSVAPRAGRRTMADGSINYNFYTNEKIVRCIHSKWLRPKKNGLSRVKFPGSKPTANNLFSVEFYHKDKKNGLTIRMSCLFW
eukprot:scaffold1816_cov165-Amphora_coffeaeformis.AAC.3